MEFSVFKKLSQKRFFSKIVKCSALYTSMPQIPNEIDRELQLHYSAFKNELSRG